MENPFEASKRKQISKTTYTEFSAEEVEEQGERHLLSALSKVLSANDVVVHLVQTLFEHEFQRYSLGMEDCQQFCLRLLVLICPDDKDLQELRTYLYMKSFAYRLAVGY